MANYVNPPLSSPREEDVWNTMVRLSSEGADTVGTADIVARMAEEGTLWTINEGSARSFLTVLLRRWHAAGALELEPYGVKRFRYRLIEVL